MMASAVRGASISGVKYFFKQFCYECYRLKQFTFQTKFLPVVFEGTLYHIVCQEKLFERLRTFLTHQITSRELLDKRDFMLLASKVHYKLSATEILEINGAAYLYFGL